MVCAKGFYGEKEKAFAVAQNLPHVRESRESVLYQFKKSPGSNTIDMYLRYIVLGESNEHDEITIDFGVDMIPMVHNSDLLKKLTMLRESVGYRKLPGVRIRDNEGLGVNQVRLRYYSDYLLDKSYTDHELAADEIMNV